MKFMKVADMTLDLEQHIEVKADIGDVFKGVLHRFGDDGVGTLIELEQV